MWSDWGVSNVDAVIVLIVLVTLVSVAIAYTPDAAKPLFEDEDADA